MGILNYHSMGRAVCSVRLAAGGLTCLTDAVRSLGGIWGVSSLGGLVLAAKDKRERKEVGV